MTEPTKSISAPSALPTTLTDLTRAWQWLEYKLMETGGEMDEELDRFYAEIGRSLSKKVDAYDHIMARLEAGAEMMKAEAKRFSAAAKAMESHRERLRDTLKVAMEQQGIVELQGERVRFKLSNAKAALEIDEGMVPLGPYTVLTVEILMESLEANLRLMFTHFFGAMAKEHEIELKEEAICWMKHRLEEWTDYRLDKDLIRADLEAGKELAFARLVPVKTLRRYAGGVK